MFRKPVSSGLAVLALLIPAGLITWRSTRLSNTFAGLRATMAAPDDGSLLSTVENNHGFLQTPETMNDSNFLPGLRSCCSGAVSFAEYRGWSLNRVDEVLNVPRSVRDNPGSYRSVYSSYHHYTGGK